MYQGVDCLAVDITLKVGEVLSGTLDARRQGKKSRGSICIISLVVATFDSEGAIYISSISSMQSPSEACFWGRNFCGFGQKFDPRN